MEQRKRNYLSECFSEFDAMTKILEKGIASLYPSHKTSYRKRFVQKYIEIRGLSFHQVSHAHPEEYRIYDEQDDQVGHMRLRHGQLMCFFNNIRQTNQYLKNRYTVAVKGDGSFYDDKERYYHFNKLARCIKRPLWTDYLKKSKNTIMQKVRKHIRVFLKK
jgi:methionine aminopeptidase